MRKIVCCAFAVMLFGGSCVQVEGPSGGGLGGIWKISPTYKDVKYGAHDRNTLNFWQVRSDSPTGLIVVIHGGGWIRGQKTETISRKMLSAGVSYCTIDYRLSPADRLPAQVKDAARAIQFLRSKAKQWNIDPERIVAEGGSAGAASSLWLAYHDDLADPKSDDPVARQSSRIAGAVAVAGQSTLDPFVLTARIGPAAAEHPMIWRTLGAKSLDDLMKNWAKYKALSIECSPITHVTKDDPPVYLKYNIGPRPPVIDGDGIHHEQFGMMLKEKCDRVGVECTLQIAEGQAPAFTSEEFLKRILAK